MSVPNEQARPAKGVASIAQAQEYLRLMRSLPVATLGPTRNFPRRRFWQKDPAGPLKKLEGPVHAGVTRVDESTYRAASAWHAAAWMLDQAALIAQVATHDVSGMVSAYQPQLGAPVFRGQRDSSWGLVPTLFRTPSQPAHVLLAMELFVAGLQELLEYEENRMNGRFVAMAAAQHYGEPIGHEGLRTPLLDFTVDPQVAVHFACRGAADGADVVVYGMPLGIVSKFGGRLVLPPPWLKRLWRQRGLFLDYTALVRDDLDLKKICLAIHFPATSEFSASVFDAGEGALFPAETWFEELIPKVLKLAHGLELGTAERPLSLSAWIEAQCGPPPFQWFALEPSAENKSMAQVTDMCEWLALKVQGGQFRYDLNALELLLKDNEPLFRSYRVTAQFLGRTFGVKAFRLGVMADRHLALMDAVKMCVEEAHVRGNLGEANGIPQGPALAPRGEPAPPR